MKFWLATALLCVLGLIAQEPPKKAVPGAGDRLINSLEGKDLYVAYCAACHGPHGKGDGPMASELKHRPANLTELSRRSGGVFPKDEVRRFIAGQNSVAAHGNREMPIWGPIFSQVERDTDYGQVRLENLVRYIENLQGR